MWAVDVDARGAFLSKRMELLSVSKRLNATGVGPAINLGGHKVC